MARTEWKDRVVERPRTFTMQNNVDGTVTLVPSPGQIIEPGTPVNAQNLNALGVEFDAHLADYATFKEDTENTIGTEVLPTTSKTLKGAIAEVFQSGNNVKVDMVDALLSVDDSLPISYESTWEEIESATEQISTGLEIKAGDIILITSNEGVQNGYNTTYKKLKEVQINFTGEIRVSFNFSSSSQGGYARIYINGEPRGIQRFRTSSSYATYTQDFNVNEGDLVQLYLRAQDQYSQANNNVFEVKIDRNLATKIL